MEFSRPLVGTQDFDKLLTFDRAASNQTSSWTLDDNGKILRFPYVEPNQNFTLTISGAVTAADGSKLGQDVEVKVFTGEMEPAVGFASQGSVLPAKDSRGLPVVSINVAEVDVEFMRVRDASLPRFFAQYQRGGRRGSGNWIRPGTTRVTRTVVHRSASLQTPCTSIASCWAVNATSAC